jgi:hypothetical protein
VTGPPERPERPMRDELTDAWSAYDELTRRLLALEEITERLAATTPDPIAQSDYWEWKAGATQ